MRTRRTSGSARTSLSKELLRARVPHANLAWPVNAVQRRRLSIDIQGLRDDTLWCEGGTEPETCSRQSIASTCT